MLPLVLAACTSTTGQPGSGTATTTAVAGSGSAAPGGRPGLLAVRHVWVIELENQGCLQSFGTPVRGSVPGQDAAADGALENYCGIGQASAANYVTQLSQQGLSPGTQADCPVWTPFPGAAACRRRRHGWPGVPVVACRGAGRP